MSYSTTSLRAGARGHFSGWTKKGASGTGLTFIGAGVIAGLFFVLIYKVGSPAAIVTLVSYIALVACPLLIVGGFLYIVVSLLKPTRGVSCPECNHVSRIFRKARKYVCSGCGRLLIFGKEVGLQPKLRECGYCGLEQAVSSDAEPYPCSDCGVTLRCGTPESDAVVCCPGCGREVPSQALFCCHCKDALVPELPLEEGPSGTEMGYDLAWTAGMSATGYQYLARAAIEKLDGYLDGSTLKGQKLHPYADLNKALLAVEAAIELDSDLDVEARLLESLDRVYLKVLEWAWGVVKAVQSEEAVWGDFPHVTIKEEYLEVRRRIEKIGGDDFEKKGSLGRWNSKLIQWEQEKDLYGNAKDSYTMKGCYRLEPEIERFRDWFAGKESRPDR